MLKQAIAWIITLAALGCGGIDPTGEGSAVPLASAEQALTACRSVDTTHIPAFIVLDLETGKGTGSVVDYAFGATSWDRIGIGELMKVYTEYALREGLAAAGFGVEEIYDRQHQSWIDCTNGMFYTQDKYTVDVGYPIDPDFTLKYEFKVLADTQRRLTIGVTDVRVDLDAPISDEDELRAESGLRDFLLSRKSTVNLWVNAYVAYPINVTLDKRGLRIYDVIFLGGQSVLLWLESRPFVVTAWQL